MVLFNHINIIQDKYFEKARQVAAVSDYSKTHIGCVAVYQNQVIGIGCNSNKTHPKQAYYNKYRVMHKVHTDPMPKIHAEIMCINSIFKMDIDFAKVHLYIYRIRKDIPFGLSRPCPACLQAIKDLGITHIHYTTNDGYAYEYIRKVNCYEKDAI